MRPLFFREGEVYFSRDCEVLALQADGEVCSVFSFPDSWCNRLLDCSKLMYRLRRSGVYSSIVDEHSAYFAYQRQLYRFDFQSRQLQVELKFDRGNGPLQISLVKGIEGFEDCVVLGEYFSNPSKAPIRILQKRSRGDWRVAYTFAAGSLNHIHHVVPDPLRNCLWVLGGDFGAAASLWQIRDNFSSVQRIVGGQQRYRACVAFPVDQGLLYATDTQFEPNSIRLLEKKGGVWQSRELASLNGPCIHGCELQDYFVFSTATEPSKEVRSKYRALLDNRPGPGIRENQSEIIVCAKSNYGCKRLAARRKDALPYRLFQFGSITFPSGVNPTDKLYAFNIGSKSNDLCTEIWQLS